MKTTEANGSFDSAQVDATLYLDMPRPISNGREVRRVNVDFPVWVVEALDAEAGRLGVTRQSIIKVWIADRLAESIPC